jgi:hypothetical protein
MYEIWRIKKMNTQKTQQIKTKTVLLSVSNGTFKAC